MTEDLPRAGASGKENFQPPAMRFVEQHELFQQILRRDIVSRRSILRGSVTAAGAAFLLGSGYAFIALDVVPAAPDGTATMTLRAINEQGVEFDRVVFSRDVRTRPFGGDAPN